MRTTVYGLNYTFKMMFCSVMQRELYKSSPTTKEMVHLRKEHSCDNHFHVD